MYTILVVDDEEEIRSSVAELLVHKQYRVYQAKNGKEAMLLMEKTKPDLIISDILMPVMDGLRLLELLKTDVNTKKIPFLVISAKSSGSNKEICLAKGANEYINKPFSAFDLYNAVERNLKTNQ